MKIFIYITFVIFILTSCGKNKEVKIIAKNAATGVPYSGLQYTVVSSRTAANGEKYRTEASGTLNGNGEAMVSIKQKTGRSYSIRVVEPENTCYNKQITQFFDSPYDVNGTFTFEFAECAYLKQNISNINCQSSSDYMILFTSNKVNSLGQTGWEFNGCDGFTGTQFSKVPIGAYNFEWHVTRLGVTNVYYDTIILAENEYRVYDINY